ncbi:uncharacterized protein LOC117296837 [Asterias rubens]|uniref:uncharacterized protein LOC117296837 n=1 Tax=Asterias rubens TaxID=7604 RepID=UPI0014554847|nr:uncharacterized protein LOC117296837 [Asterias rubens]
MEFTRIEGASFNHGAGFNPLPQKVPMRYSFSLDQKRILMKHYENGMFGQSLAYQDKIVACAQEAGVDFDIVRNWIGNMRRKRRMEDAQKTNMTDLMMPHDPSAENKRRFLPPPSGAFPGSLYLVRQPAGGRVQQPRPPSGPIIRPNTPGSHLPLPTSLIKNTPLATRDQNVALPSSGQPSAAQPSGGTPSGYRPVPSKHELDDEKSSCQVASTAHQPTSQPQVPMNVAGVERREQLWSSQQFPDETIPLMRGQGQGQGSGLGHEANDHEWRQQQIQSVMNQVQQSVQQLEGLGCECVVATVIPSDGGTYITGTPIAVQYFSEIQKIQAMADYVNPLGPPSIDSEDTQNDAIEEANSTNRQRNQLGQGTKSDGVKQTAHDDQTEAKDEDEANEEGEGKAESERKEGEVIRTGEEVYIVNKDHFVIGTGTLLPAPHRRIELKNVPLP